MRMERSAGGDGARPVVLVTGATGAEGGSVARHLLRRGRFAVRALARDPGGEAARALRDRGAEVVRGDLDDAASLRAAVSGCYGAYGVTSSWEHHGDEWERGSALADAVSDAGVGHFVLSAQPPVGALTGGALRVPHFDARARVAEYARALALPATFVHVPFLFDGFLGIFAPRRESDGSWSLALPLGEAPLAGVAAEDVGGVVAAIFERRAEWLGRTLNVVGDELAPAEYAAAIGAATGRVVRYAHVPREAYAALGFRGAADIADMLEFHRAHAAGRADDIARCRELHPELQRFERWAARHREELGACAAA
jgi:uncharacterized protein YbjT (DUF2867 family)